MKLLFLDTETTGNDTKKDRLCQVCYKDESGFNTELFKPPIPISVKSMSIIHITNEMVEDKPAFKASPMFKDLEEKLKDHILVAHNAKFDIAMLEAEGLSVPKFICTLRLARYIDEENKIPEYNLQFLRYFLKLEVDGQAHDAEGDVRVLDVLFQRLYKKFQTLFPKKNQEELIEKMVEISAKPSLIKIMPFGKYKGISLKEIASTDIPYLEWLLQQKSESGDDDEDWIYTLTYYIKG